MRQMTPPLFPDDFRVLYADGGASYWHWHPDAPDDYDGTWKTEEPPPWAGGLMIGNEEYASADRSQPGDWVVSWEYGPETESGSWMRVPSNDWDIQNAVNVVIAEVNEASAMSSSA